MTEKNHDLSGYSYAVNNPVLYTDPFGLDTVSANTEQPVYQGDVVTFTNGTSATQSVSEATVTGCGYNTVCNVATPRSGIRMGTDGGLSTYAVTKGSSENFVDPFLLSIDMIYSLNLSGANNGDPRFKGGSGPGGAINKIATPASLLWKVVKYSEIKGLGLDTHHVGQGYGKINTWI
jgi:hypothetical protein